MPGLSFEIEVRAVVDVKFEHIDNVIGTLRQALS